MHRFGRFRWARLPRRGGGSLDRGADTTALRRRPGAPSRVFELLPIGAADHPISRTPATGLRPHSRCGVIGTRVPRHAILRREPAPEDQVSSAKATFKRRDTRLRFEQFAKHPRCEANVTSAVLGIRCMWSPTWSAPRRRLLRAVTLRTGPRRHLREVTVREERGAAARGAREERCHPPGQGDLPRPPVEDERRPVAEAR
jgi:hypothetical protein